MNEYDQQAIDFLETTQTEFTAVWLDIGVNTESLFNDEHTRDRYTITLKRGSREYTFIFTNSANNTYLPKHFILNYHPKLKCPKIDPKHAPKLRSKHADQNRRNGGHYPTAYDVLTCLTKYDPNLFDDFCGDYGYDTDSRKAEKVYQAVKDEYLQLCALFNESEMKQLCDIN